ncbi:putative cytochrome P450 hydroxylase [Candidatus Phaeomarinobacter ectocarpi]|uniref:Putative cytochrome P450 hydroxylase n=1 Tax=Candidatus Phaeomarinibacter ectocarpi TaxID=1458461 RepID=X5MA19_9HYPH|nr:cytochrome P450 [Candidatus Phaeomarinobacter ectocarpi]CDO60568.1 putative cytochrome P450 hydroxylase [Candidatus Phaeomarinobacter ectocarpi]
MTQATAATPLTDEFNPAEVALRDIDLSDANHFFNQHHWKLFERLRNEDPVHFFEHEEFGRFWSVTRHADIMSIDTNHQQFSSEPSIFLGNTNSDEDENFNPATFIAMDPPKHDAQRNAVNPAVAPPALRDLEPLIRQRVSAVLDSLPIGETFNWVDLVSIEITTQMLATLFDFPFEDRYMLTRWSDMTTANPETLAAMGLTIEDRRNAMYECLEIFGGLYAERAQLPPANDFISLMAHNEDMKNLDPMNLLGNLVLLIVGGNDTTRNSMSGGVLALHENPAEFAKLKADPSIIPNMVSEIIRWQTPLAYMRRTANEDLEFRGKQIKQGDRIMMWYVSGNRDERAIERPNEFLIDRENARRHLSFGFGIHRCMGNRVGEMQVRILWEEILKRFDRVEVVGKPARTLSNFVMGFTELPVRLHPKK